MENEKLKVLYDTCKAFIDTYNVLNAEFNREQKLKASCPNKEEKKKHNDNAVQLNGIIQRNKFDFINSIIDLFK